MAYEKQTFLDRVVDSDGNVVEAGTTLKAEHLNHIEEGIEAVSGYKTKIAYARGHAVGDRTEAGWRSNTSGFYCYADNSGMAGGRLARAYGDGTYGTLARANSAIAYGLEYSEQPIINGTALATVAEVNMFSTEIAVNVSVLGTINSGDFICLRDANNFCTECRKVAAISDDGRTITLDEPYYEPVQPAYNGIDQDAFVFSSGTKVLLADLTEAVGNGSAAFGCATKAYGDRSFVCGHKNKASGARAFASGELTEASGPYSYSGGYKTVASSDSAHAEGRETKATNQYSHAEGYKTEASGAQSHAEGSTTVASSSAAHAEGFNTKAIGSRAHSEGESTEANGNFSHVEGIYSKANGNTSHAEGRGTIASGDSQHVQGQYNIEDTAPAGTILSGKKGRYADIVGNGTGDNDRSNARTLDWNGNGWYAGDVYVGGTSQDSGAEKLVKASDLKMKLVATGTPDETTASQIKLSRALSTNKNYQVMFTWNDGRYMANFNTQTNKGSWTTTAIILLNSGTIYHGLGLVSGTSIDFRFLNVTSSAQNGIVPSFTNFEVYELPY